MLACPAAGVHATAFDLPDLSGPTLARAYVVAKARADELYRLARESFDGEPVPVDGGSVGFRIAPRAAPAPDAAWTAFEAWTDGRELSPDLVRGFLESAPWTVVQCKRHAKKAETDPLLVEKTSKRFGIWAE